MRRDSKAAPLSIAFEIRHDTLKLQLHQIIKIYIIQYAPKSRRVVQIASAGSDFRILTPYLTSARCCTDGRLPLPNARGVDGDTSSRRVSIYDLQKLELYRCV